MLYTQPKNIFIFSLAQRATIGRGRLGPVDSCAKRMGKLREAHGKDTWIEIG